MRHTIALASFLFVALLAGCGSKTPAPAPTPVAPDPSVAQPLVTKPKENPQPVAEPFDCGKLIANADTHLDKNWTKQSVDACHVQWTAKEKGLKVETTAVPLRVTPDGGWKLALVTGAAPDLQSITVTGTAGSYTGALFHFPPESTGGAFFGPIPWALAVGGRSGVVLVTCTTLTNAENQEGAGKAQAQVDSACPALLRQVTVTDLGPAVAFEK